MFAGGWTLEAAESVCTGGEIGEADVLDLLSRLVDRSLVVAEPQAHGVLRYRLLETIRQYAAERLHLRTDREAASDRHRAWFLMLSEQALESYWLRSDLAGWWLRLRPEQADFRSALSFSFDRGDAALGLRPASGLWVLWGFCGPWTPMDQPLAGLAGCRS